MADFTVPVYQRIRLKGEKRKKYLDLSRELKKLWNLRVTVKPILIVALETDFKGLIK